MPLTRAEIHKNTRANKKREGKSKLEVWVINNEEARQQVKTFVAEINERYNCFKFNNGDGE